MSVQQADSSDMARFIYLSDGTKVGAVRGDSQRISYRGSYLLSGHSSLSQAVESVRWAEGVCATRTDGLGMGDYLYVTDHLGNVRSTVALYSEATAAPGTVVLDRSDYLPFGERVADLTAFNLTRPFTAEGDLHRWHLGGKEEVPEGGMNLLDFGARYYDPALCRWTTLDPLSEKYYDVSPYVYCADNPTNLVDKDGRSIDDYYSKLNAKYLGRDTYGNKSRLIDDSVYKMISKGSPVVSNTRDVIILKENSQIVSFNEDSINIDAQTVAENSNASGVENQVYIVLDRENASIASAPGITGDNGSATMTGLYTETTGVTFYDRMGGLVIIGEIHGHPQSAESESFTEITASLLDLDSAASFQVPVFAIDAMTIHKKGNSIHLAHPNGVIYNNVGKTVGKRGGTGYPFGQTSLKIWGHSGKPDPNKRKN